MCGKGQVRRDEAYDNSPFLEVFYIPPYNDLTSCTVVSIRETPHICLSGLLAVAQGFSSLFEMIMDFVT